MEASNAKEMREALEAVVECAKDGVLTIRQGAFDKVVASLSTPPRNCDVGTVEEQARRFELFCDGYKSGGEICVDCPFAEDSAKECAMRWAQLPYAEASQEGYGK